nr:hypothetical protein [Tanacetum cinerariifolium]
MIGRTQAKALYIPPEKNENWVDLFYVEASEMYGIEGSWYLCPPFLLYFENRVNGEWAEGKEVLIRVTHLLEQCKRLGNGSSKAHRRALGYVIEREDRGIEWQREVARQVPEEIAMIVTVFVSKRCDKVFDPNQMPSGMIKADDPDTPELPTGTTVWRTHGSVRGGALGFQYTASKIRTSLLADNCRPILELGCWIRDPRLDQHPTERGQSLEATETNGLKAMRHGQSVGSNPATFLVDHPETTG